MKQLTEAQATVIAESNTSKNWTNDQIVRLQLYQRRLCMPFERFHQAVEAVLGRPVWTHEFMNPILLQAEYEGTKKAPTLNEIMNMIPAAKRLIVWID